MPTLGTATSNLQLLKLQYREFLRKTATYHRSEGDNYYAIDRACAEAKFEHSFDTLRKLATANVSELRAYYRARRERAKERLRRAINTRVSQYLGNRDVTETTRKSDAEALNASAADPASGQLPAAAEARIVQTASSSELQPLYGTDGPLRRAVLYLVGHASRAVMSGLNSTRIHGQEALSAALSRPAGQGLVTVSNHVAALDDPLVVATMLPQETLEKPEALRWTLCATDRCFRYAALVPLFTAAKVLPVKRGGGMAQPGMAAAEARLAAGDWVHIFPEGTRSPDGRTLGGVRKGVGRLVASVPPEGPPPLLVPFVHRGMENVMPRGKVLPATGQQVDVLVGEPIPVADLLSAARAEAWPEDALHTAIAGRVATALRHLTDTLDARRAGLPDPPPPPMPAVGGAAGGDVSSLDQFDPSDLALAAAARRRRQGAVSAAWERLKFRMAMQNRSWATQGVMGLDAPAVASPSSAGASIGGGAGGAAGVPLADATVLSLMAGAACGGGAAASGGVPVEAAMTGSMAAGGVSPYLRHLLGLSQREQERERGPGGRFGTVGAFAAGREMGRWWA